MIKKLILTVILSSICCILGETIDSSPVLILTNRKSDVPLDKSEISSTAIVGADKLKELIEALHPKGRKIIVTVEDMSPEAIRMKNADNKFAFTNVKNNLKLLGYYPLVDKPVERLEALYETNSIKVKLTPNNEFDQDVGDQETVFVEFRNKEDDEEDFPYWAHLDLILFELCRTPNDIVILAARKNGRIHEKQPRQKRDVGKPDDHTFIHPNVLFHYSEAFEHSKKENTKPTSITITSAEATNIEPDTMQIVITVGKYKINLHLSESAGSWAVKQIDVDGEKIYTRALIDAPNGFSFMCSSALFFKVSNNSEVDGISIRGLQFQPQFGSGVLPLKRFGDAVDCVGFTSAAIWGGLFITFILLFILTIGITFIMDIRTMDRFDDPKGKTITINAQD